MCFSFFSFFYLEWVHHKKYYHNWQWRLVSKPFHYLSSLLIFHCFSNAGLAGGLYPPPNLQNKCFESAIQWQHNGRDNSGGTNWLFRWRYGFCVWYKMGFLDWKGVFDYKLTIISSMFFHKNTEQRTPYRDTIITDVFCSNACRCLFLLIVKTSKGKVKARKYVPLCINQG